METTYFLFDGVMYRQVHSVPMGRLVLVVVSDMFMENLEETAMDTAQSAVKPKIIDDPFKVVSKSQRDALTEYLNNYRCHREYQVH